MDISGELRNRRILVVDDNPAIHDDFRKILNPLDDEVGDELRDDAAEIFGDVFESPGRVPFEVDSAFQGQEALTMVMRAVDEDRPYPMAFVDIRMPPGWDGIETVDRIWQVYPDLQVVICTAYSDYSLDEILERIGVSDRLVILKKPFDNVEAVQLANALTEKWYLLQQSKMVQEHLEDLVDSRTRELREAHEKIQEEVFERRAFEAKLSQSDMMDDSSESGGEHSLCLSGDSDVLCGQISANLKKVRSVVETMEGLVDRFSKLGSSEFPSSDEASRLKADLAAIEPSLRELPIAVQNSIEGFEAISGKINELKDGEG